MSASSFNRPGAVDLSGLAQRAQQAQQAPPTSAGPRPGGTSGGTAGGGYVIQLTEETFEAEAIRRSLKYPVVVEFYSPRVATGQQLSDALIELAAENAGQFLLGRINVDGAPGIVQALQLQAVPTVIALIGGQLAPLFQGVLPKDQVSAAIDQLLKAALANGIVGRAEPVGPAADPEPEGEDAAPDPRFAAADEALERGDFAAAEAEFDLLLAANPNDAEAQAGKAQAGLLARVATLDPRTTLTDAAAPGASVDDHLAAADIELATGDAEAAFGRLIDQVKVRSGDERDRVRVRLLALFETLGNADERVLKARRALMTALF